MPLFEIARDEVYTARYQMEAENEDEALEKLEADDPNVRSIDKEFSYVAEGAACEVYRIDKT